VNDFPQGELHADGMFMVGESLFEAKQYDSALSAYRAAKPLLETSNRVKPENRWLTLLHAAQSANKQKDYAAAVELAKELADDTQADSGLRLDASLSWVTLISSLVNLSQQSKHGRRRQRASTRPARATCMLGETLFSQKKFDEAARQFKQVILRLRWRGERCGDRPVASVCRLRTCPVPLCPSRDGVDAGAETKVDCRIDEVV
jgi:tetratricopeptide (TPR) repeat protein